VCDRVDEVGYIDQRGAGGGAGSSGAGSAADEAAVGLEQGLIVVEWRVELGEERSRPGWHQAVG
jgi:hypothetical protein